MLVSMAEQTNRNEHTVPHRTHLSIVGDGLHHEDCKWTAAQ